MQLDFSTLAPVEAYRWLTSTITPRPIAWVSTCSTSGVSNLAPFSFFQVISSNPPTLLINVGLKDGLPKDTARNANETGELVVQLVSAEQAEAMNASAATLPHGISEFEHCVIASEPASLVKVQRVAGAPVAFECRVAQILPYPPESPNWRTSTTVFSMSEVASIRPGLIWLAGWAVRRTAIRASVSRCSDPSRHSCF